MQKKQYNYCKLNHTQVIQGNGLHSAVFTHTKTHEKTEGKHSHEHTNTYANTDMNTHKAEGYVDDEDRHKTNMCIRWHTRKHTH